MRSTIRQNENYEMEDSGSPMDNISNMSDAMLVLAVGIMLALVINWKIDIKEVYKGEEQKESVEDAKLQEFDMEDAKQNNSISFEDIESKYVKSGTVYTDTYTGKTYVVIE